eukprot:6487486-Pyramimonas_sp.AAC.1
MRGGSRGPGRTSSSRAGPSTSFMSSAAGASRSPTACRASGPRPPRPERGSRMRSGPRRRERPAGARRPRARPAQGRDSRGHDRDAAGHGGRLDPEGEGRAREQVQVPKQ